jgi:MarR family 2-MHQ and catechol resistance regulon transcriptional repressor
MTQTAEDMTENEMQELIYAMREILKLLSKMTLKVMAKENITEQQMAVLNILMKGPVQMNQLCRELIVSSPNITTLVDRMEKKGLVNRTEDVKDRRKTEIQLTPNGKKLFDAAKDKYREYLQESLRTLTPQEREKLSQLLGKLKEGISRKEFSERPTANQTGNI